MGFLLNHENMLYQKYQISTQYFLCFNQNTFENMFLVRQRVIFLRPYHILAVPIQFHSL